MPYLEDNKIRESLKNGELNPFDSKELNYLITSICHKYIGNCSFKDKAINEVIGVLERCKLELYRQIASPFLDDEKSKNGPISELDASCYDKKTLQNTQCEKRKCIWCGQEFIPDNPNQQGCTGEHA